MHRRDEDWAFGDAFQRLHVERLIPRRLDVDHIGADGAANSVSGVRASVVS